MNWNRSIRQFHRWVSIFFVIGAAANMFVLFGLGYEQPPAAIGLMALLPLITLALTGLYMFILPYTARKKSA